MANTKFTLPASGQEVVLVDRASLRASPGVLCLRFPDQQAGVRTLKPLPPIPQNIDWAGSTSFPILGNNQYGDCFYTACAHVIQGWAGANGDKVDFDAAKLVARYLQVAGGDNGLYWDQMVKEFKAGIIGPGGPHKAYAIATIDPRDRPAMAAALHLFGPLLFTLAIPDRWLQNQSKPGGVWDAGPNVRANQRNGHAVIISAMNDRGYLIETWGIKPQITLTFAGLEVCDPESAAVLGSGWFRDGQKAANGFTYKDLQEWWEELGGGDIPDEMPWVDPHPPTPPNPGGHEVLEIVLSGTSGADPVTLRGTAEPRKGGPAASREESLKASLALFRPDGVNAVDWASLIEKMLPLILELLKILGK